MLRMLRPTRGLGTVAGGEEEAKAMSYKPTIHNNIMHHDHTTRVHNAMDPMTMILQARSRTEVG